MVSCYYDCSDKISKLDKGCIQLFYCEEDEEGAHESIKCDWSSVLCAGAETLSAKDWGMSTLGYLTFVLFSVTVQFCYIKIRLCVGNHRLMDVAAF